MRSLSQREAAEAALRERAARAEAARDAAEARAKSAAEGEKALKAELGELRRRLREAEEGSSAAEEARGGGIAAAAAAAEKESRLRASLRATEVEREAYKQQLEVALRDAAPAAALREALEAAKARLAEATAEVAKLKAAGPHGAKSFKRYDELLEDNRKLQV